MRTDRHIVKKKWPENRCDNSERTSLKNAFSNRVLIVLKANAIRLPKLSRIINEKGLFSHLDY